MIEARCVKSSREFCHAGQSRRKVPSPKSAFPAWKARLGRRTKRRLTVAKKFAEGYLDRNLARDLGTGLSLPIPKKMRQEEVK